MLGLCPSLFFTLSPGHFAEIGKPQMASGFYVIMAAKVLLHDMKSCCCCCFSVCPDQLISAFPCSSTPCKTPTALAAGAALAWML